jgi:hypothetical protein
MAAAVYRFIYTGPSVQSYLQSQVGGPALTLGSVSPAPYLDVNADTTQLDDITSAMLQIGYTLFATDPGTTVAQQAAATNDYTTLQAAYNNGAGITTASSTAIAFTLTSGGLTTTGTGTVSFGADAAVATYQFGTGAAAKAVTVGSTNTTSALTLQSGTGAQTFTAGGTFDVNATGALTLDSSGGAIGIGTDAVAQAINIGTGAAARNLTLGNVTGATAVVINAGTGASSWTVTGTGTLSLVAGTGAVGLASNATDHSTTLGSTTGTSATTIQSGTGNLTLTSPDVRVGTILTTPNTGLHILDTNASHDLILAPGSDLTADRTLTLTTGDAARTFDMTGAQGSIYYVDASGNTVSLAPGTSGQFLRTNGAAANPTWATSGGGGSGTVVQRFVPTITTSGPTTTSTTFAAAIPECTVTITPTSASNPIRVVWNSSFTHSNNNANISVAIYSDGVAVTGMQRGMQVGATAPRRISMALVVEFTLSVAAHTLEVRWLTSVGTVTAENVYRYFSVEEVTL